MGRCYLWAPEGDTLKRDPVQAAKSLKEAYTIVDTENVAVSRGEAPRPARLQEIANLLTDASPAAGDEKSAADWAEKAIKSEFGTNDQVAADTAYTMGYYFETQQKYPQDAAWYERLKGKASGASDANLANLCFSGKGVKEDQVKAAALYRNRP